MSLLRRLINHTKAALQASASGSTPRATPQRIARDQHNISRADISEPSLKVLYRLHEAGFGAYLVGGAVRDLLLGRHPKDFDIATDARPEDIKKVFRNCRLIGRRFRLAHIHFGETIIEVATFRAHEQAAHGERVVHEDGRIMRDNVYGTLEEDVWRRDFTANALYYHIADFAVVDFVGGMADIQARQLRLIGDPVARYREDPVRLLRAVRFAAKLDFTIHRHSAAPITELANLLASISSSRLFEEVQKLFMGGAAEKTYQLLRRYQLFGQLFPQVEQRFRHPPASGSDEKLLVLALQNTDKRLAEGKPVTPAFIVAALLWGVLQARVAQITQADPAQHAARALEDVADEVIHAQVQRVGIPKRLTLITREIWSLQATLTLRPRRAIIRVLTHPRFRAAYDFLLLRAQAGEDLREIADWWTAFQDADESLRAVMMQALPGEPHKRKRRRSPPRPRPPASG